MRATTLRYVATSELTYAASFGYKTLGYPWLNAPWVTDGGLWLSMAWALTALTKV
jgi:hypothetical protein